MIELDRDAPLPIADQLVEQLRYHLAAGRYRTGERLPSTRKLAEQVGISFHTVRKAYQRLEGEGLLESRRGGGFYAAERPTLSTAERRERGAAVMQDAIQRLITLGLSDEETEYLFEEQRQFFESPGLRRKLLCVDAFRERAESVAELVTGALQERVEPIVASELGRHPDADVIITTLSLLQSVLSTMPKADVVGIHITPPYDVLERVARLGPTDMLGLVSRSTDAVAPVVDELRALTGFSGQLMAFSIDSDRRRLETLSRQTDLILYTPQVRRRLRPILGEATAFELTPIAMPDALLRIRDEVGR